MRTLVIGDIHGAYKALIQVLEKAHVTPDDKLIFLGDYVDGWSQSPEVIEHLLHLKTTHNCIFIQGNHDELLLDYFIGSKKNDLWLFHGGEASVNAYEKLPPEQLAIHIDFLKNLTEYHIDEENRLFLHAGFTNLHGVTLEFYPRMFYWDRTLWETALALDPNMPTNHISYPKRLLQYKEIYIGHTPVSRINESTPQNRANVWNIDTGAAYKNPLTILDVDTKEFWQSDNVNLLYPDENGRN